LLSPAGCAWISLAAVRTKGGATKARAFAIFAYIALPGIASAQTGNDLYKMCSGGTQERMGCNLYISGFLHGLQASQDLPGKICLPDQPISGGRAAGIYLEFMTDIALAAAIKKDMSIEQNPFFTAEQSHSLFGVLAMTFPCPKQWRDE
jgi:hypothetical protein